MSSPTKALWIKHDSCPPEMLLLLNATGVFDANKLEKSAQGMSELKN